MARSRKKVLATYFPAWSEVTRLGTQVVQESGFMRGFLYPLYQWPFSIAMLNWQRVEYGISENGFTDTPFFCKADIFSNHTGQHGNIKGMGDLLTTRDFFLHFSGSWETKKPRKWQPSTALTRVVFLRAAEEKCWPVLTWAAWCLDGWELWNWGTDPQRSTHDLHCFTIQWLGGS